MTEEKKKFTRREALACGGALVGMFAVGGVAKVVSGNGDLLRPPGGQDEAGLLGACIKCDRCRSACPTNVIGLGHLEDGIANVRTPLLDFSRGYCTFCAGEEDGPLCVRNCPTGALRDGFDAEKDKIGMAFVDPDECLLYRSRSRKCSKICMDYCEFDALTYVQETNELLVDEQLCNGCGGCEYACDSTAYGSYTGSGNKGIRVVVIKEALR